MIPKTTWKLRPSFPKKKNPKIKTRMVFMCPSTWNDTAVNLPMQMNWLRLVPIAMVHDRIMKNCNSKGGKKKEKKKINQDNTGGKPQKYEIVQEPCIWEM